MKTKLEWALEHAKRGWRVFPLQPGKKIPYAGLKWKDVATSDEDDVRSLWEQYSENSNIGIATGIESNLTVIDVDDPAEYSLNVVLPAGVDCNYVVKTPSGGYHQYHTYERSAQTGVKRLPGADIRNDGGYVVGAGSDEYTCSADENVYITPFPEFLRFLMENSGREALADPTSDGDIGPGQRNGFLTEAAGRLQRLDVLNVESLDAINKERCNPPVPRREVEAICRSVQRYSPDSPIEVESSAPVYLRASDYVEKMLESLADKSRSEGLPTCFPGLNDLLGGGFRKGELIVVHAQGKRGKSSTVHQLIHGFLLQGVAVGYASREMDVAEEVLPNLVSIGFGENAWKLPMTDDLKVKYANEIGQWNLYFAPGFGPFPADKFEVWVNQLVECGVQCIFVDHFHYCIQGEEDYANVVNLAHTFKRIAKEKDIALVSIVQPKNIDEDDKLSKSTLRGGAAIGQALDVLITLERHRTNGANQPARNIRELHVLDVRHKLAKTGKILVQYDPETTQIAEIEVTDEEVETTQESNTSRLSRIV